MLPRQVGVSLIKAQRRGGVLLFCVRLLPPSASASTDAKLSVSAELPKKLLECYLASGSGAKKRYGSNSTSTSNGTSTSRGSNIISTSEIPAVAPPDLPAAIVRFEYHGWNELPKLITVEQLSQCSAFIRGLEAAVAENAAARAAGIVVEAPEELAAFRGVAVGTSSSPPPVSLFSTFRFRWECLDLNKIVFDLRTKSLSQPPPDSRQSKPAYLK